MKVIAEQGINQIIVTEEFAAPPALVFRAFTEPELMKQWLGPHDYEMTIEHFDLRDGGRWQYSHTDPEGNVYTFHGVFHGIASVEAGMVQTFEFAGAPGHVSLDTATFEPTATGTLLRTNTIFQSVEARDAMLNAGMTEGMQQGYAKLAELLKGLYVVAQPDTAERA